MSTKVIISGRFSYFQGWEPKSIDGDGPLKYSTAILIPKSDKKQIKEIEEAVAEAVKEGIASKWSGKKPANLKLPLRDGDEEKPDDPNYEGMYFLNASCNNQPGIVDKNVKPILDRDEVYSGCYGRISVNFYPFNKKSNGIAAGLNNIQKLKDGEPLAGGSRAEDDFSPVEVEDDDLLG